LVCASLADVRKLYRGTKHAAAYGKKHESFSESFVAQERQKSFAMKKFRCSGLQRTGVGLDFPLTQ